MTMSNSGYDLENKYENDVCPGGGTLTVQVLIDEGNIQAGQSNLFDIV
jgi:hypothetical protein